MATPSGRTGSCRIIGNSPHPTSLYRGFAGRGCVHSFRDEEQARNCRYIADVQPGREHCVAVRSDGNIVAWGDNQYGQLNVPAMPAGVSYLLASAGWGHTQAVRSDGLIVAWGVTGDGQLDVPTLPSGVTCTQIACGDHHTSGLLSDGTIVNWGFNAASNSHIASLPAMTSPSSSAIR